MGKKSTTPKSKKKQASTTPVASKEKEQEEVAAATPTSVAVADPKEAKVQEETIVTMTTTTSTARHVGGSLSFAASRGGSGKAVIVAPLIWNEQIVILPTGPYALEVRAWQTGARLGALVVEKLQEKDGTVTINNNITHTISLTCMTVTPSSLVVGLSNGTVAQFAWTVVAQAFLLDQPNNDNRRNKHDQKHIVRTLPYYDVGPYRVPGPVLVVNSNEEDLDQQQGILHFLSTPTTTTTKNDHDDTKEDEYDIIYALQQQSPPSRGQNNDNKKSKKRTKTPWNLVRIVLPRAHDNDNHNNTLQGKKKTRKKKTQNKDNDSKDEQELSIRTTSSLVLDTLPYHDPKQQQHKLRKGGGIVDFHVRAISATEHLVVIARPYTLHVYLVVTKSTTAPTKKPTMTSTILSSGSSFTMTCLAVHARDDAVAIGLANGEIKLWPHFVTLMQQYLKDKKSSSEEPPALIARMLHWHAHPVQTLAFYGRSTLYSGGIEAVLVQWEFATHQGTMKQRPATVLPRLAVGALTSISTTAGSGRIMMTAADATLQVYECHNHAKLWRVQLWPGALSTDGATESHRKSDRHHSVQLLTDPNHDDNDANSSTVLVTGVSAGRLLWYNTAQQQVTRTLQAVALNSVSRTEPTDEPWPVALVTHAATSRSTLVTIDTQPTENLHQGRSCSGGVDSDDNRHNLLESLKFWKLHKDAETTCTAVMPAPHGAAHKTTALAVSVSGKVCCTVSNDDKSFRIWRLASSSRHSHAVDHNNDGDDDNSNTQKETTSWRCAYRVAWPAGFAKQRVGAVSFSSDGSIVALAFNDSISLWSSDQGSFLTSLHHLGGSPIESLQFCCKGRLVDTILSFSKRGVVMQSPFQQLVSSHNMGWTWESPSTDSSSFLTRMLLIDDKNVIVVAWYHMDAAYTTFLVIDAAEGTILHEMVLAQSSPVTAMAAASSSSQDDISFYAMTSGNLFLISTADDKASNQMVVSPETQPRTGLVGEAPVATPLLHAGRNSARNKRTALVLATTTDNQITTADSIEYNSSSKRIKTTKLDDDDEGDTRLPRLRGSVTREFLGRHLKRR
eukprot:scaffold3947_cov179-Amphora_coffeaeformis.AAC.11